MSRAVVILDTEFQRRRAQDWVWAAKSGSRVEFKGPKRSPEQNSLMWSLLTEVAVHMRKTAGLDYSTEEWKHIFLHGWGREIRFLPSLDGKSVVPIPQSSSDLSKEEMTDFIEFILKEGAERGVKFHEPSDVPPVASDEGSGGDGSPGLIPAAATDQEHGAPMEDGPGTAATTGSSSELTDKDREWIVMAAKMLVAATEPGGDPDVIRRQYGAILKMPETSGVSESTIAKAVAISKRLVAVCEKSEKLNMGLLAGIAGCDEERIRA